MSLSKQLYIIISIIFFMIFAGNFIISVKNTKEYLEIESITKAQDTATSLGMSIKPLIHNKNNPEIESIIKAIANRGFYKEIRLEDIQITFTNKDLIKNSNLDILVPWIISDVKIDKKYGKIESQKDDSLFEEALDNLDDEIIEEEKKATNNIIYNLIPEKSYEKGGTFKITFKAKNSEKEINSSARIVLNKVLVKEFREEKYDYVPQWFIDIIKLNMEEKSSEISDGWSNVATVYVSANAGDAYAKLYEQARGAIIYSLIAFLVAISLLIIFLGFILKPLKNIEKLAKNIAQGEFDTIKKLPYTTEIKNVAIAMNDMSNKIEGIIKKLNTNIQNITQKISQDDLTKLEMEQTFETDMKDMFIKKTDGYVLSLKIEYLGDYAKKSSNSQINSFIKEFAKILSDCNKKYDSKTYRFFGSEFAMIVKNRKREDIINLCKELKNKFDDLNKKIKLTNISNIGATIFNQISTTNEILAAAIEARENAKQIGPNEAFIRDENDLARDMESWRELIFDIIDNSRFEVGYIGDAYILYGENRGNLLMQEAFTRAFDKDNNTIPIGTFISIAEKYEKVIDFDKAVINKVIEHIKNDNITHEISINLSLDSIIDNEFIEWIEFTLKSNKDIASKLVFSITAYGVAKDINKFKIFAKIVNSFNGKIIIKRFESKFIPLQSIKNLHLDYIRLARDYTNGIATDSGKNTFVESMQDLCNLVNIKVIAENVKKDNDLDKVKEIELYAASR